MIIALLTKAPVYVLYVLAIYVVIQFIDNKNFNIQDENDLGKCNSKNDIECIMGKLLIPIEIRHV
jgi:hypothetical protein